MLTVLNFLVLYIYSNYGSLYHNVVTKRTEFKNIYIFSRCLPSIFEGIGMNNNAALLTDLSTDRYS